VPRWLYGVYVIIPIFALMYVLTNVPVEDAGGGEASPTPEPGPCEECTIVASGVKFDKATLEIPSDTEVTVILDNQDAGVIHDFAVWESEEAATSGDQSAKIATTNPVTGVAEDDVTFTAPDPGTYYFNCTYHPPSMFGDLEVVAAS
jgi:plastocyanin